MIGYRFLTNLEREALDQRREILRAARRLEPTDATLLREALNPLIGPEGVLLPPIVDFDVLFIPDASEKIALIAPGSRFMRSRAFNCWVRVIGSIRSCCVLRVVMSPDQ